MQVARTPRDRAHIKYENIELHWVMDYKWYPKERMEGLGEGI